MAISLPGPPQPAYGLSPWTVEFLDKTVEAEFQQSQWRRRAAQNQIAGMVWTAILLLQSAPALASAAIGPAWASAMLLGSAVVAILAAGWPRIYHPGCDAVFSAGLSLTFAHLLLLSRFAPSLLDSSLGIITVAPTVLGVALNLRAFWTFLLLLVALAAFGSMLSGLPLREGDDAPFELFFLTAAGVGVTIHRLIESSKRSEFAKWLQQREANRTLQAALDELAAAKAQAERANQAKSDFLAVLSHEIRTPIHGILGLARLLGKGALAPVQLNHVEAIRHSAQSLLGLLTDLLDAAKMEAGEIELRPAPLQPDRLLAEAADLLRAQAEEKGLRLEVSLPPAPAPWVNADRDRVRQVLVNLIANGVKFTDQGWIRASLEHASGGPGRAKLVFRVANSGPGIPEEERGKIFDRFAQGRRATGGVGLGLAIAHELARRMDAELELESPAPGATVFRFTLAAPVVPRPDETALPLTEPRIPPHVRILVVEDHPINALVLEDRLRDWGCMAIETAPDGRRALDHAQTSRPDLILLDCGLPELDGFEVARRFRQGGCRAPIVAVTAYATAADRERCLAAGMDDVLVKPIDDAALAGVLRRFLELPDFDSQAALAQNGHRPERLAQAIALARADFPNQLDALARAAVAGDLAVIARLAHRFAGALATLHAPRAARAAQELLAAARAGDATACLGRRDDLAKAVTELLDHLPRSSS